jgi:hypothetical protein
MLDFLASLHKYDTKKVQQAREAMLRPGKIYRRREYKEMDRDIKRNVATDPLNTDAEISNFMEAISLLLRPMVNQIAEPEQQGYYQN